AVRAAVEQAELRRGIREVFLGLARRTQALVHRQLGLLDGMERRGSDAEGRPRLFPGGPLAPPTRGEAGNPVLLCRRAPGRGRGRPRGGAGAGGSRGWT